MTVPSTLVDGLSPSIKLSGLTANEVVRLHALRSPSKWQNRSGQWQRVRQPLHAYADFAASADGVVEVASAAPLRGTYAKPDPLALLRTGLRFGAPALQGVRVFPAESVNALAANLVQFKLERNGQIVAEAPMEITEGSDMLLFEEVSGDGWHGVFARPRNGRAADERFDGVVSLHGSEGGSVDKAKGRAGQLAAQGFAVLAMNYFAYPFEQIKGVPTEHAEINIEIIEAARTWLKARPEVDSERLALHGVSKGAELALLAAARYDWITAVVAVVPTDVVWEGYSQERGGGGSRSSWSFDGKPLPFVPLFAVALPEHEGLYRTNTERYERSRAFHADSVALARIPVEKIKAKLLLLAGDRDEVWASGTMTRNLLERRVKDGRSAQTEAKIYPKAGHQIAGPGAFPVWLYGEQSDDPNAKDIIAEGEAAADAWQRTVRFLKQK